MRIAVLPDCDEHLKQAIKATGAKKVDLNRAEALLWTISSQAGFPEELPDSIRWVQLKSAGVRPWLISKTIDDQRDWSSAAGAYSEDVAEHAVGMLIALMRNFPYYAHAKTWTKEATWGYVSSLRKQRIAIIGCGSIGRAMIAPLTAFGAEILAVNRSGRPVEGAAKTVTSEHLDSVLEDADHAIIAGASTPETNHMIALRQLELLGPQGNLVNIARGDLIDSSALEHALTNEIINGAALDVTEPEPLPDGHPFWHLDNVLITPHVANPQQNMGSSFARFVKKNIERVQQGMPPLGLIDTARSY